MWQPRDTVNESLTELAELYPDKELYVFYNKGKRDAYTASTLYTLAGRFANRLRRLGFQHQDVIANTLPNSPERVVTDLGIMMAGCMAYTAEMQLNDGSDFYNAALRCKCKGIILVNNDQSPIWNLLQSQISGNSSEFITDKLPQLTTSIVVSRDIIGSNKPFLEDLLTSEEDVFVSSVSPNDVAVVFCTSGTTGYSKLVDKTHAEVVHIVRNNEIIVFRDPECPDKRFVQYSDRLLAWGGGFAPFSILAFLTRVLRDNFLLETTSAESDFWEAVTKENCTFAIMMPIEVYKLLEYAEKTKVCPVHRFQYVMLTGQPITKAHVKKTYKIAEKVFVGYGSTECFDVSQAFADEETYESYNCGKTYDGVMARVVNDNNELCRPMEKGAIQVKGKFRAYFNLIEKTDPATLRAITPDGWFNMEDYGCMDVEGNLFVYGRNKDVITTGDAMIYPGWVEDDLTEHPDVVQACLVPVSDPIIHQKICACLKMTSGSKVSVDEMRSLYENLYLHNACFVIAFFLLFKEDFPELNTGKPDKIKLRKMAEERFGYKGET
ncbi:hypothetical protein Btru_009317 [Bulinus truncatus]|nr:hypothetical protein Btru_009317 [Bulinus truncatus]